MSSELRRTSAVLILTALAWLGVAGAAAAQDLQPLLDRIDRLERDVNMLQRQVYRGAGASGGAATPLAPTEAESALSTDMRMTQVEEQMRNLTGQIEELRNSVDQMKHRLDTLSSDVDQRFAALPGGAATAHAATAANPPGGATVPPAGGAAVAAAGTVPPPGPATPPAAQPAALPPGPPANATPKQQYDYAFDLLERADYVGAEAALKSFLQQHPTDPLAGNAQYWLGETYYVRKDYEAAAAAYAVGYQKYPKGGKGPDFLLKLGMSLGNLDKKKDACVAFTRLDRDYPTASPSIKEHEASERQRLGC